MGTNPSTSSTANPEALGGASDAQLPPTGEVVNDGRKPIESVLYQCRRTFYFAFFITFVADLLSIAPLLYMMNVFDRVISSRSGITLVSLTLLILAIYVFWSAIEWIPVGEFYGI